MANQNVADVLAYTQDMMVSVIDEQWDVLADMQIKQDEMLKDLFSVEDQLFSEQEKVDLFEVQRLNQEILNLATSRRTDIANELRGIKQGKAKACAYQSL